MLLEKVMALSAVKPANKSSQPASSRPVSSARKTVSGFPAGSNLALAKRSSGMTVLLCRWPHRSESRARLAFLPVLDPSDKRAGDPRRLGRNTISHFPRPEEMAIIGGKLAHGISVAAHRAGEHGTFEICRSDRSCHRGRISK